MILALMVAAATTPPTASSVTDAQPDTHVEPAAVDAVACKPGIALLEHEGDLSSSRPIEMQMTSHRKVSNAIGFALTGGISGLKIKTVLEGDRAKTRSTPRPAFAFCFEPQVARDASSSGAAYVGATKSAVRPQDFSLVRFDAKSGKNRELAVAKSGFGSFSGALSDSVVRIEVIDKGGGLYIVRPNAALSPGEYGFIRATSGGAPTLAGGSRPEQVFDFGVDG